MLLNHGCAGHGVVEDLEVVVDGLGCDFLAEPLLQHLMGHVQTYYNGPPDIIPHLLNGWVVDEVQIVALYNILSSGELVGDELPLTQRNAASVDIGVVAGMPRLPSSFLENSMNSLLRAFCSGPSLMYPSSGLRGFIFRTKSLSELLIKSLYE